MSSVDKRKTAEEVMVDLLLLVAKELYDRIRSGEASPSDISNAIKLLQNNGITVAVNKGEPLDILAEVLPFEELANVS